MTETIEVSESFHEWLTSQNADDETMEETIRRLTGGPHPSEVTGLLTESEAEAAKEAAQRLRERDGDRLDAAREAFGSDE